MAFVNHRRLTVGVLVGLALTVPALIGELRLLGTSWTLIFPACGLFPVALLVAPFWSAASTPGGARGPWEWPLGAALGTVLGGGLLLGAQELTRWRVDRIARPWVEQIEEQIREHGRAPATLEVPPPFRYQAADGAWELTYSLGGHQELQTAGSGWDRIDLW